MSDTFLTITEAVNYTGKSRRTLHRLAQHLTKTAPDQVMRERTNKGEIWRIHQPCLSPAASTPQSATQAQASSPTALPYPVPTPFDERYLEFTQQGYGSLMTMHHEVKVIYEALLHEKDCQIQALTQTLAQRRRGFWDRCFGR